MELLHIFIDKVIQLKFPINVSAEGFELFSCLDCYTVFNCLEMLQLPTDWIGEGVASVPAGESDLVVWSAVMHKTPGVKIL